MKRPLLLDLYSGAGGCGMGYHNAGFEVVGVDIEPMPRYPFEFHQANALEVLDILLSGKTWQGYHLSDFAAFHGSPPCQHFTNMLNWDESKKDNHPDLIAATRERFQASGKLYVIENVEGAKDHLVNPIMLCGNMFGLRVYRHRLFEISPEVFIFHHHHIKHKAKAAKASRIPAPGEFWSPVGCFGQKDDAQRAMGIDWMKTTGSRDTEIAQAVPPIYTQFIGTQLLPALATSHVDNEVGA